LLVLVDYVVSDNCGLLWSTDTSTGCSYNGLVVYNGVDLRAVSRAERANDICVIADSAVRGLNIRNGRLETHSQNGITQRLRLCANELRHDSRCSITKPLYKLSHVFYLHAVGQRTHLFHCVTYTWLPLMTKSRYIHIPYNYKLLFILFCLRMDDV